MRAEAYTVQHTLTPEAAAVVKQSLVFARRRGHVQVTPLHVASAMLTSSTGLLRKAFLQINTHPLQCKALELCFNVALNRLPSSQLSPITLSPNQSSHPSLSNALVAAFKRALAHQRRGSIENQHQPVLALKVEVEQLIISILDDPSVSRVMREAGFSSTQIKNSIEQSVSMETSSQRPFMTSCQAKENINPILQDFQISGSNKSKVSSRVRDEDVMSVIDTMMERKRKNIVVIRECLVSADEIVRGVIDKFEKGNNMVFPVHLRFVQFVSLPLHSLCHVSREEIEDKVKELSCLLKSYVERGVILYLGDLKWVSDYWSKYSQKRLMTYNYSPMDHMIMELSRLMFGFGDSGKMWLMGTASSQTYMSCKIGHPSLETLWDLFPHTTRVGGLDLTLNLDSKDLPNENKLLTCCGECSVNFTTEARSIANYAHNNDFITTNTTSTLPLWLQLYKGKNSMHYINDQECDRVGSLRKKWNSICSSLHKQPHFLDKSFHLSSPSFMSSKGLHQNHHNWPIKLDSHKSPKEHQFFTCEIDSDDDFNDGSLKNLVAVKPELLSNPSSSPNSASCSEASEDTDKSFLHKFKEVNSENIKVLSNALEKRVPRQREIIPEIVSTILRCRSGLTERKGKEETWLFFLGDDSQGKEMISRELATVVFGSKNNFIPIGLSCFSSRKSNLMDGDQELIISNKRARDEHGQSYIERFAEAVQENGSRVFYMEDIDQVEYHSQMVIKKSIEKGRITLPCGKSVHLKDAIVILSCESFSSVLRACSPLMQKESESGMFDLNIDAEDNGIFNSVDKQVIFNI